MRLVRVARLIAVALVLDTPTVVALVLLAALITLAIWAPGPLRGWRAQLGAAAVAVLGFVLGRGTKSAADRPQDERGATRDPREGSTPADTAPEENEGLTDALNASDKLLREARDDPVPVRPHGDLSDDELRERLERATDD